MTNDRRRWLALSLVCVGVLMIVLDGTIVTVALPSIQADLGFSQESLAWVVNAYLLAYGGFLLFAGRAGDLFGRRRLFMAGLALFTLASLVCGLSGSQAMLVVGRAVQGLGGALLLAVGLSLVVTLFPEPGERAKAMGIYTFVASGGGTIGVLLGGVITQSISWEWIFLVNVPIGIVALALCPFLLPGGGGEGAEQGLDVLGAALVTGSVVLAVYGIVGSVEAGWVSTRTLGLIAAAVVLAVAFVRVEAKARAPLVPLRLFQVPMIRNTNLLALVMTGAFFAWFFFSALYMQRVLGFSSLETGLSFLPATLTMGALSLGPSARAVQRFGARRVLVAGTLLVALGLGLFARAPVDGDFVTDVLPAMFVLGVGAPLSFMPLILTAMSGVAQSEAGLASGLITTSQQIGGALGLAVLASLASSRTDSLAGEETATAALNAGFHLAFLVGAALALATAVLAAILLREETEPGELASAEA